MIKALPEIQIQAKRSAKRLKLRVYADKICLTTPFFCSQRSIQTFIQQSQVWLLETWQKQQQVEITRPHQLQLFNLEQPITITYQAQKQAFYVQDQQLFIDESQVQVALKAFIFSYAKQHLPLFLQHISTEINLPYQNCNIRQAKTRWGSCSSTQNIMLNSALVLCKLELVRYVCVHELVHTVHMNHSSAFWQLVAQFDSHHLQHRQSLKQQQLYGLY
jgi:predicted metal-dependent hydrolase